MTRGWKRVDRNALCPICESDHNCTIADDGGAVWCGRQSDGSVRTNGGGQYLHILRNGEDREWWVHASHKNGVTNSDKPPANYAELLRAHTEEAKYHREGLAESLGVSTESLESLGVGYSDIGGKCFTFPERDANGSIIGINRRFESGQKKAIGARGLTYDPQHWDRGGPVLLPEGGSDTAALTTMGLSAIGRPSNVGGVELLAEFIQLDMNIPDDREIIVIAEDDRLKDGKPRRSHAEHGVHCECGECFPGLFGARTVSKRLADLLKRPVTYSMPPGGAKDARAWLNAQGDADPAELGREFITGLKPITTPIVGMPEIISLERLIEENPVLSPAVIEGIARRSEVVNLIAKSKVGKSWFGYGMAMCVAAGWEWLGRFPTSRGRVLIIDNELPKAVLAHRIPKVQAALQIPSEFIKGQIDVISLRGNLMGIMELDRLFGNMKQNDYSLIILDAMYRMLPDGMSENDNAAMAQIYNQVDRYAAMSGAAIVIVHHATKGGQSDKDVTDIGAGAGSQSRAADTHLVLRPHEEQECAVLEAAVRSWAPVSPVGVRWEFPVWIPDGNLNPESLKGRKPPREEKLAAKDQEDIGVILARLQDGAATKRSLRDTTGIGPERITRLLGQLVCEGKVSAAPTKIKGNECYEFSIA